MESSNMPNKENVILNYRRIRTLIAVLLIVAVLLGAGAVYFYAKYRGTQQNVKGATEEDVSKVVAQVGKLIVLPQNEVPTLATVSDPEALKSQPFFANAQKGDKVLIYTQAKKAIL